MKRLLRNGNKSTPKKLQSVEGKSRLLTKEEVLEELYEAGYDIHDPNEIEKGLEEYLEYPSDKAARYADQLREYLYENSQVTAAKELDAGRLFREIKDRVHDVMVSPGFEFEEDDVDEYSVVEVKPSDDGRTVVEVRADLSFSGLTELAEALNPIVQKYDKDSYFEPVTSGILEAWLDVNLAKTDVEGASYGGAYDLQDDQYFTVEEIQELGDEIAQNVTYEIIHTEFGPIQMIQRWMEGHTLGYEMMDDEGNAFTVEKTIDMRKIRKPSDLKKYSRAFEEEFVKAFNEAHDSIVYYYPDTTNSSSCATPEDSIEGASDDVGYSDYNDPRLQPPESTLEEVGPSEAAVEFSFSADVQVAADGSWTYDDTSYSWAKNLEDRRGDWRSDEGVLLDDPVAVVEHVDSIILANMPLMAGHYRIQGDVELVYDITGVQVDREYLEDGSYEDTYVDVDNADAEFNFEKSAVRNFKFELIDDSKVLESVSTIESASTDEWPEPLTYDEYDEGDQLISTLIEVVEDLNLFEEPSAQGGVGSDYFYDDQGEMVAKIDLQEEADQLEDMYFQSTSPEDFHTRVTKWLKKLCHIK